MRGQFIAKLRSTKKRPEVTKVSEKIRIMQGNGFVWKDLQNPDRSQLENLQKEHNLNALNIEDCLTKFELPKLDGYLDHIFFILHFPPLGSKEIKHSQLSIFAGKGYLITVHQGDLDPLTTLVNDCEQCNSRGTTLLKKSLSTVLHEIIDLLVDDLLHMMRRIISNLDEIEDAVFDDKKSIARRISILRREIVKVRRTVGPLKRIVSEASSHIEKIDPSGDLQYHFDDVTDHIDKIVDMLEEARETMEIYKDTDFMLSTEKTNKVLTVLTMIFTLTMPTTLTGTLYGMNVVLPGADLGIEVFGALLAGSFILTGIMFVYFKKMGWFTN
ncbi:MAG: Mg2 and Co2 transporter [Cenarchaeum symbiont of Oopsacas minuta]|nr:Mg2 and Co2 transporter [Cenarchaeum symbiont of Oopsacas minuta]